jgi:hypothetical protein
MSIEATINALVTIKSKIIEQKKILKSLKKEENELIKQVKNYLNENDQKGIRLDEITTITLQDHEKKILMSKNTYKTHISQILYDQGIDADENLINKILDKTNGDVVQEQRLKFVKKK